MPVFNCHFTAKSPSGQGKISRYFKIEAPTQDKAVDRIVEQIGPDYGYYKDPNFTFGKTEAGPDDYHPLQKKRVVNVNAIDAFYEFVRDLEYDELGQLVREYVTESCVTTQWEGFTPKDLTGLRKLFADIMLYHQSKGETGKQPLAFGKAANHGDQAQA